MAGRKLFVGSLPNGITDAQLRSEFGKYGTVEDVYVKQNCEPGRQWAFVTMSAPEAAQAAKDASDRILHFPGADRPCDVMVAKNQGMFGQEPLGGPPSHGGHHGGGHYGAPQKPEGPKKIFVGSLPQSATSELLSAEFSRYGQVVDVFLNSKTCEPGRNWAFITFATSEQAAYAKDAADRILVVPGADQPCQVMLAKNQGKNGQDPIAAPGYGPPHHGGGYHAAPPSYGGGGGGGGHQPPPPSTPPPPSLTPWRMYKTASGLPYYHNHSTGQTMWECPPDLQVPGQGAYGAAAHAMGPGGGRYSPY